MSNFSYAKTFAVLLYRDIRFIINSLPVRLIDAAIIATMQTLVIGSFLPLLGMPTELIAPLFIGMMTQIVFSASYSIAFKHANDLHHVRFINYQMALPLPKVWLFAQLVCSFMIEIIFITLPPLALGSVLLRSALAVQINSWLMLLIMYFSSLTLYSLLFLYLAFGNSYTWFLDNVWARRLTPLFFFGCGYYPWKKLLAFNAGLAYLFLCNPITYIHEGLRSALFGTEAYLPVQICIIAVALSCLALAYLLSRAVKKRLDPV